MAKINTLALNKVPNCYYFNFFVILLKQQLFIKSKSNSNE